MSPWNIQQLRLARQCSAAAELMLLYKYGRSHLEADIARWEALGRNEAATLAKLNNQERGEPNLSAMGR